MKKHLVSIVIIINLFGCTVSEKDGDKRLRFTLNSSTELKLTDQEWNGVKDAVGFFKGESEISTEWVKDTDGGSKGIFEIRLFNSNGLDQFKDTPKIAASNIAYRIFRNWKEENDFTHVRTILHFKDDKKLTFEVTTWELGIVHKKMNLVDSVVNILKNKQYDDLANILNDSSYLTYNKQELIENVKATDPQFGNITQEGFNFFGYEFIPLDNKGNEMLHITGIIMRDIQNNEFSINLNPYIEEAEILSINYKF